jgi:subtilase family protein
VFGHAAVDEVLSVAAADAATPGVVEPFSSAGPASIFFPARETRQAPRLTAVDAVETAVGRRGQFANPFRGTSAAAPHVAGCAALALAAGAPPAAVGPAMVATAVDIEDPGVDPIAGAGRLDCGAAAAVALGRATPPVVSTVAGIFDATGAVQVDAVGEDAEGDVRDATVRLLAPDGSELERTSVDVSATGTSFGLHTVLRAGSLAQARTAAVVVRDAAGLESAEAQAALACPGDGTLGDALCVLGDLIGQVATVPGRAGRRLSRRARAAASVLSRAGGLAASGRDRGAGRALRRAAARLRALERALRHDRMDPGRTHAFAADAAGLRARVLALRATFT